MGDALAGGVVMDRREELGRIVLHERRRTAIDVWRVNPDAVLGWDELAAADRESLMREAEAVANAVRGEIAERLAERVAELIMGAAWPEGGP